MGPVQSTEPKCFSFVGKRVHVRAFRKLSLAMMSKSGESLESLNALTESTPCATSSKAQARIHRAANSFAARYGRLESPRGAVGRGEIEDLARSAGMQGESSRSVAKPPLRRGLFWPWKSRRVRSPPLDRRGCTIVFKTSSSHQNAARCSGGLASRGIGDGLTSYPNFVYSARQTCFIGGRLRSVPELAPLL